ncbi:hypothetical protein FOL75_04755 [Bacillus thuringiensis]|nr:hypothetical protein [Bacillus thuringiensis]
MMSKMDPRQLLDQGYKFSSGRMVIDGRDISMFQLQKSEIVNLQFDRLIQEIKKVEDSPTQGFSSIALTIDGYNETVEELYEIQHVRRFFSRLVKKLPHILYYINPSTGMPHQIITALSDFHQFRAEEVSLPPLEILKRDGHLENVGKHQVILLLPSEIGYKMLDAIQSHVEKANYQDKQKELPVLLKMIEYSIPEKDRRIGWEFRYKKKGR